MELNEDKIKYLVVSVFAITIVVLIGAVIIVFTGC